MCRCCVCLAVDASVDDYSGDVVVATVHSRDAPAALVVHAVVVDQSPPALRALVAAVVAPLAVRSAANVGSLVEWLADAGVLAAAHIRVDVVQLVVAAHTTAVVQLVVAAHTTAVAVVVDAMLLLLSAACTLAVRADTAKHQQCHCAPWPQATDARRTTFATAHRALPSVLPWLHRPRARA